MKTIKSCKQKKGLFITGTDTSVGKTIATLVLGVLLKEEGYNVGVMKPVQCAGDDAQFLKRRLKIHDRLKNINPYFAKEPLSPNLAFHRIQKKINPASIVEKYKELKDKYDVMLVEGAGGLLVPIKRDYLMVDLIKDLELDVVIVSRLGLGTINHTLLTINQARDMGLHVKGVLFNQSERDSQRIPERTNPDIIKQYGQVDILGIIDYLESIEQSEILKKCRSKVFLESLLKENRNGHSQAYRQADKQFLWHPFTQMQDWLKDDPLIIEKAKGSYLIDTKGKKYLDGVSSLWVNVHGHGHKVIDRAIKEQINRLSHSTLLGLSNTPSIELARRLVRIAPKGLEKVFYSDNGSTSVEIAVKMAYQYWQNIGEKRKRNIVHLANSYHGDTLGSVSVGGIGLFRKVYKNLTFKTIELKFPDCYRAPKGKKYPAYAFECLEKFENTLKKRHASIAAMVVEPIVQGAAGMIMWPKGILKRMSELCKKYNIIFIADEVATGFGRTGKMFACEHEDVSPDILCLAKGLTAGYLPLAATLTTEKIYNGFLFDYNEQKTFFHGHTYTGNPLCCSAALANLEVFKREKTLEKLQPKIKYLSHKLQMFYNLRHVGDIRQRGFMVGIELVRNRNTKEPFPWEEKTGVQICQKARENGVFLRPLGNVLVLMPPLSINTKELDHLISATYWAINEILP